MRCCLFLNVDLVFFSLEKRYATSSLPPKCEQPASHTHPRRHKQKKREVFTRARARIEEEEERSAHDREEDALKDAAAFFLAEMEKEEEQR